MSQPLFTPRNDLVPIVQEAGWAPGLVWTGAENLAPARIRFPDCPARSQSLYRLPYPAHIQFMLLIQITRERLKSMQVFYKTQYNNQKVIYIVVSYVF
jgi:hypothetical protein